MVIIITLLPDNDKSRKSPSKINFCTWDIETDYPNNPKNVLKIGFYNGENYFFWNNTIKDDVFDRFLGECLKKKYYGYSHYAHFGGKFDFIFLLEKLKEYKYEFEIIDVNGRMLEISINIDKEKGKIIKFRDSYSLISKSLKDITQSFSNSITHQKLNHDFDEPNKDIFCCIEHKKLNCFDCYLKNDVISLYQSIKVFENIINKFGGQIQLTVAATSLDIFKHNYLNVPMNSLEDLNVKMNNGDKIILKTENIIRDYYFGGRCEIFKRYGESLHYYDVNSLYPYCMLQKMPISKPLYAEYNNINFEKDCGFVFCDNIEFWSNEVIPLIPFKLSLKYSKKLIYPLGKWSGWLDLDLFRKAKRIGYTLNPKFGIIFNSDNIFKDFINDFYELRSKNDTLKLVAKLIMNSAYGKFAQKRIKKQIIKYNGNDESILKELKPYLIDEFLYEKISDSESKHIIPSISAHITSLAQLELYKYIELIGKDEIYYVDTDSVITTKKLNTSKKLGDIKLEHDINKAIFLLPKTYCLQYVDEDNLSDTYKKVIDKITMKGFIKNKFTFNDFYYAFIHNDFSKFTYKIKKIYGFKESLKRNKTFLTYDDKINSIISEYDKRKILDDRINTKPLTINNGVIINE